MSCSVAGQGLQGCRRAKPCLWVAAVGGLWCQGFSLLGSSSTCQVLPKAQRCLGLILAPNRTGWAKINTHLAGAVH